MSTLIENPVRTPEDIVAALQRVDRAQSEETTQRAQIDWDFDARTAPYEVKIRQVQRAIRAAERKRDAEKNRAALVRQETEKGLVDTAKGLITVTPMENSLNQGQGYARGFLISELKSLIDFGSIQNLDLRQFLSLCESVRTNLWELRNYSKRKGGKGL